MHISRIIVIVVAIGCGSKSSDSDHSDPPPAKKPPAQLLRKGEPAFVRELDDGSLRLVVGRDANCDGTRATEIELPQRLGSDGRETWTASSLLVHGEHLPITGEPSTTVRPQPGGYEITLDVKASNRVDYEASGTVVAQVCKSHTLPFAPLGAEAPPSATMTIAGKLLHIRGAIRRGDDLELSDAPRSCNSTWVSGATLARTNGSWTLDGERIAKAASGDGAGLVVKFDRTAITLSGHTSIGGFAVELAGHTEVLECDKRDLDPKRRHVEIGGDVARGPLAAGPDDRETIGCVIQPGPKWCYAHLPDGRSAGCTLSDFQARYVGTDYIQFEWDRRLAHAPGPLPECTGVQGFASR